MEAHQLEKDIEQACRRYAESVGAKLLKLQGSKGWPDRLLLHNKSVMFIEFKRPGAKPSPLQQHILNELRAEGYIALWIDSLNHFKLVLGNHTNINNVALIG